MKSSSFSNGKYKKDFVILHKLFGMKLLLITLLSLLLNGDVTFDKTTHDFGTIKVKDGPQTCTFTLSNNSDEPVTIFAVISTCGCTDVTWTRESIAPGQKGEIKATYSNDEGAYPFNKALTVYTSYQKKPIRLNIKGVVSKK